MRSAICLRAISHWSLVHGFVRPAAMVRTSVTLGVVCAGHTMQPSDH